ncbi:hypothetical protein K7432_011882 [Basidiobolus ranarum]|uniref:Cyclin N-terminal domain-containing protein n=1 Tax=Basidiobolus ranarum TaxID=34480 RepID=A0ABR2WLN8_9FUNG
MEREDDYDYVTGEKYIPSKRLPNSLTVVTVNDYDQQTFGYSKCLRVSGLTPENIHPFGRKPELVTLVDDEELSPFTSTNSTPYTQDEFNIFGETEETAVYTSPTCKKTREVDCDVIRIDPHRSISTDCCWVSSKNSNEARNMYGEYLEFTDSGTYIEYTSSPVILEREKEIERYWIRLKTTDSFRRMLYSEKEYSNLDKIKEADWRVGVDMIFQLTHEFNFHIETILHATSYFVRCLTNCSIDNSVDPTQLAIVSFVVAGKSCEENLFEFLGRVANICHLDRYDLLRYEIEVLESLEWSTLVITPYMVLAELVTPDVMSLLLDSIEKYWIVAILDWRFLEFSASVLTISALVMVTEEKGIDLEFGKVWSVDWVSFKEAMLDPFNTEQRNL